MTIRRATKADLDTIRSLWEAMEERDREMAAKA